MSNSAPLRIASGQGFWGDLQRAPIDQARRGPIDVLVMDYLAEVTMSILQKQKLRDPEMGYARDFVDVVTELASDIREKGFKVISNAGGVNPVACAEAIVAGARERGAHGLKVAVVTGDDLLDRLDDLVGRGVELKHMETGEPISTVLDRVVSANAYLGARPIAEALAQGADVVVTGRTTDTGLTLAPLVDRFGWDWDDWDKMAAGTVAGHILECGAQSSGGNFTDWQDVPDMAGIGFPITEVNADGSFVVTKHEGSGGLVSRGTVAEQLLYEIGDPTDYITPDVVADFTSIRLDDEGSDRVRVSGIEGGADTEFLKVSAAYADGWKATSTLVYAWPNAAEKARAAAGILRDRLDALGLEFDEYRAEILGAGALSEVDEAAPKREADLDEVQLRVSVRGQDKAAVEQFGREIAPLILTGPSAVTGFAGGRPRPSEVIAYWPALIPKSEVKAEVRVLEV
ncbi:acyclic terpene utilization AtuA family protein [Rubrivirga sp. S365]|uniref:acyclic terpene utilization AtuA family protein n=1 Tax=Rubrivirga sp. S365 TaxID=3076080 RepID=UPI0028C62D70|nr:acyclic terpene utilization AtuA family protein [Rubrivirga sp. S365]MDT7856100.1 acyclic terpene utilization AtuA family protein [Rubrivirga sp. S365]